MKKWEIEFDRDQPVRIGDDFWNVEKGDKLTLIGKDEIKDMPVGEIMKSKHNCKIGFTEEYPIYGSDAIYLNDFDGINWEYLKNASVVFKKYDFCPYCGKKIEVWKNEK